MKKNHVTLLIQNASGELMTILEWMEVLGLGV